MNLPEEFMKKMEGLLGDDISEYLACYEEPRYYGLRVNTLKISVEDFLNICPFDLRPIPWIENGFYYDGEKEKPSKHPFYFAGLYYLQEPSAMTPANRLEVFPGERVLDLCAAPGGKTTELGAKLQRQGILVANDISHSRAKGLLKNIELMGIPNVFVLSEEPGKLVPYFEEFFDKILIDAPCSGEGMFRKDAKMIKAWKEHGPEFFAPIQKDLLQKAVKMLRPGGYLLYSTCTFDQRENEDNIRFILEQEKEMQIIPMKDYEGFFPGIEEQKVYRTEQGRLRNTVRIFPHKMMGEGHFLALMQKGKGFSEQKNCSHVKSNQNVKLPEELTEFLKNISMPMDLNRIEIHNGLVYYMPKDGGKMPGIRFLRTGLFLGEVKKHRFEPSQAFAMSLKSTEFSCCLNFSVEDERVFRYLRGETLLVEDLVDKKEKGWYLVLVEGYPLGFGKLAKGILKNKYLPGWRMQS